MLLRFLADNLSYLEFIKGIDNLTIEQKQVLFERLKLEIDNPSREIIDTKAELISSKPEPVKIIPREIVDKPKSFIECCLHCGSVRIKKHGKTTGGTIRYICKDCNKTFAENYGLITHYTHLAEWQWLEAVRGFVVELSCTDMAKNMGVTAKTAWLCRQKIQQTLLNIYGYCDTFNSLVEADGKYIDISFKGLRNKSYFIDKLGRMPRHHRSKKQRFKYLGDDFKKLFVSNPKLLKEMILGSQKKVLGRDTIGSNHQKVCIMTAVDRSNNIYIRPITSGTPNAQDVYKSLVSNITNEAVLITDGHKSYRYLCKKENIKSIIVESGKHVNGPFNLGRVNGIHGEIEVFLESDPYKRIATKYLDLYLIRFWWFKKNKDMSPNDNIDKLYNIMMGHVSNESRVKMTRVTYSSLVNRPLPFDTKGYY